MKFEVKGTPFPVVVCNLEGGETMKCQSGAMCWMSPNMQMATKAGGLGKMFGKAITGESLFENNYTAQGGPGMITFTSGVPGDILAVDLSDGRTIIAQKRAFLAAEMSVNQEVHFQKKVAGGFFGGEGFVMQKFSGKGYVFLEIDGCAIEYQLQPGERLVVDTGSLAAMEATVQLDVQMIKGLGNMLGGGEGLFNTVLTGPGRVWLQTMPVSGLAGAVSPYIASGR